MLTGNDARTAGRTVDPALAFAALADPTRRSVFESLRGGPRPVGEIARGMTVSRPAVSQHLRVLKGAGLVHDRAVGTRRLYSVDPAGLDALRHYLEDFWDGVLAAFERSTDELAGRG